MTSNLQRLFRHDLWANRLILDACVALTQEQLGTSVVGTYGAIGPTLAHLVSAEDSYASRLALRPRMFRWQEGSPVPAMAMLRESLERVGPELIELAGSTPEDRIVEITHDDRPSERLPAWIILTQVIDHGREHRTHIATILTQLGIEPPDMDGWRYFDSGAATGD